MAWAIETVSGLRPTEKLVLLMLANYADAQRAACWPSRRRLAEQCGVRVETIKRAIRQLEDLGLIERDKRFDASGRQTSNRYTLRIDTTGPGEGGDIDTPGEAKDAPGRGAQDEGGRGAKNAPVSSLNRHSNHQSNQRAEDVPIPKNLQTPIFLPRWKEWLDYRRRSKKVPVTVRAAEMQLKTLSEVGPVDASAAIDTAIQNDYQGLFPKNGLQKKPAEVDPSMVNYGWDQR
jgi:DNA-binding transcriptional MocR family regulator